MAMLRQYLQQVRAKHGWELESRSRRDLTNSVEMLTEPIERARSTESVSVARAPEDPPSTARSRDGLHRGTTHGAVVMAALPAVLENI